MATNFCRCCGKPLTDPVSIALEIGPVCRVTLKIKELSNMTASLFGPRSDYDYRVDGDVIAITDNDKGRSVTNDLVNVLADLAGEGIDLSQYKIMYRDTSGIWDGIGHDGGTFTGFFPLTEHDYLTARAKLLAVTGKGKQ